MARPFHNPSALLMALSLALALACAKPAADLDDLFASSTPPAGVQVDDAPDRASGEGPDEPATEADLDALRAAFDVEAAGLRSQAQARPDDPDLAVAAARALFHAADARMLEATLARVEQEEDAPVERLIDIDERLPREVRSEVEGLVREGRLFAESALEQQPERADARLYRALHLSLQGWAVGAGRAMMGGLGSSIPKAIRTSLEPDPTFDGGAPLRLMGRFLDRAPWPLGDKKKGRGYLERAVETADEPVNWLFLGDAQWGAGEREAARASWTRAVGARNDGATAATAWVYQRLAGLRLERSAD